MAESWTLTSPIAPGPSISGYAIRFLDLQWDAAEIRIGWRDNLGNKYEHTYRGDIATSLMLALNKANLSLKSLQRRVLERLAADGFLNAGSIVGTPD